MKNLLIAVLSGGLICSLAALWLNNSSKKCLKTGVLVPQVDKLVKQWTSSGTAPEDRQLDIIISDALGGSGEGSPGDKGGGILSSAKAPTFFQKLKRMFFRKSLSAEEDTEFIKAFAGRPGTITWTHKGRETADEEEMARELMKAILKADEAGAAVNIITEGFAAAPALKAVSALKTVNRNGKTPTVNKVVCFNMNRPTLAKLNPGLFRDFKKPENLKEWSNIRTDPGNRKIWIMELHDGTNNILKYTGGEIFRPEIIYRGIELKDWMKLVNNLLNARFTMAYVFGYNSRFVASVVAAEKAKIAEAKSKEEEAKKTDDGTKKIGLSSRDLKGRTYNGGFGVKSAKNTGDPMDMIGGLSDGEEDKPEETEKKENKTTAKKKTTDNTKGNAANCTGNPPLCNWYDAKAYCGGRLPTVAQLQSWYQAECAGGRSGPTCNNWYWSSEESGSGYAMGVYFADGYVTSNGKTVDGYVRCVRADK